jgi:uncharacterized protein (DUF1800 family)
VRALYGNQVIANPLPLIAWLNRMGEPLYGHETPDGYALTAASWSGPGEMTTRFEVAQQIGAGAANLFKPIDAQMLANLRANFEKNPEAGMQLITQTEPSDGARAPALQETAYYAALAPALSAATKNAVAQGTTAADRNALLLSSPEFMRR